MDHEETILGVHCVAVPILIHAGRPVGAISVAGITPKSDGDRLEALVLRLKTAGEYLSRRVGFSAASDETLAANGHRDVTSQSE
jgi:DNA-binding IclR family transcriptional regulator